MGLLHFGFAIAALLLGAAVVRAAKGDQRHRTLGYLYALSLLVVNVSALMVYDDSAGVGPFHILAVVSLATLLGGLIPAFLRRPATGWLDLHAYCMSWSYVGLVAAGVAQMATMASTLPGWLAVGVPSTVIVIIGGVLIHTRIPLLLATFVPRRP